MTYSQQPISYVPEDSQCNIIFAEAGIGFGVILTQNHISGYCADTPAGLIRINMETLANLIKNEIITENERADNGLQKV